MITATRANYVFRVAVQLRPNCYYEVSISNETVAFVWGNFVFGNGEIETRGCRLGSNLTSTALPNAVVTALALDISLALAEGPEHCCQPEA